MAEPKIHLREREDSPRKCPWCHELIYEAQGSDLTWTCAEDGTVCHRDCALQFRSCPQCSSPATFSENKADLALRLGSREQRLYESSAIISNFEAIRALKSSAALRELSLRVAPYRPGFWMYWLLCFLTPALVLVLVLELAAPKILSLEDLLLLVAISAALAIVPAKELKSRAEKRLRDALRADETIAASGQGSLSDDRSAIKIQLAYEDACQALQNWISSAVESRSPFDAARLVNRVLGLKWEIERRYAVQRQSPANPENTESRGPGPARPDDPRQDHAAAGV